MRRSIGLFVVFALSACDAPDGSVRALSEREELIETVARGYYPGRSGQVFFIPEPGDVFLRRPMNFYRFMHGSPWEYDRHIPLFFHGDGFIQQGVRPEPVRQQDIAPTVLRLLGLPRPATMTGSALDAILEAAETPPKAIVVAVLDGMRLDYFERYAEELAVLSRLREEGAWFSNARIDYVPTVTSAGHTTISTGTDPRIHGIAGNGFYDRSAGGYRTLFEGLAPNNIMALGIADLWNLATDGEAVILTNGTTPRATVSLAGHGGCTPNARPTVLAMFDYRPATWATNPECFVLPDYLRGVSAEPVWQEAGGRWRDLEVDDGRELVMTPWFPRFQADALIAMIQNEGVGEDDVTDLVMVNFKTPDYVGHYYGPHSEEIEEALAALDAAIGRVLKAVEDASGAGQYVVAFSSDHGMPADPEGEGARRFIGELHALINQQFDSVERPLVLPFDDTANLQLFLDSRRLDEIGKTPEDVAAFVESLPYIRAAFGENEVRRVSGAVH